MALKKSPKFELAADIMEHLNRAGLLNKFQILPASHQAEYLKWVGEAKKPDTRSRRVTKLLNMLSKDKNNQHQL